MKSGALTIVVMVFIAFGVAAAIWSMIEKQAHDAAVIERVEHARDQAATIAKKQISDFAESRTEILATARKKISEKDFAGAFTAINPYAAVTSDMELDSVRRLISGHEKAESDAVLFDSLSKRSLTLKPTDATEAVAVYAKLAELKPDNKVFPQKLARAKKAKEIADKAQEAVAVKKAADAPIESRKEFARATEEKFLAAGYSATVTTQGPTATIMHINFVLVSKAFVYQVQHADDFRSTCLRLGFKKIVMDDGYSEKWTLTL